ncbi:MAG: hypothetical protein QXY49_02490 [Thermofilaceae archaeon]
MAREEETRMREAIKGVLKERYVEVPYNAELAGKGYGERDGENLLLNLCEAAYLLDRGDLIIIDNSGEKISFEGIVTIGAKIDPDFWMKLLVYSDLRNRGLQAKVISGSQPVIVMDKKTKEGEKRYLIICLEEGKRVGFKEVEVFIRRALEARRELITAIVDKEGNISYYKVDKVMGV